MVMATAPARLTGADAHPDDSIVNTLSPQEVTLLGVSFGARP
jgi:hypothetical protein